MERRKRNGIFEIAKTYFPMRIYQLLVLIRKEYQGYLDKYAGPAPNYPTWQQAVQHWISDKRTPADDIFNDKKRLAEAKLIIQQNIKQIQTDQFLENIAWLLVQHMDHDVEFQKWFLSQIKP